MDDYISMLFFWIISFIGIGVTSLIGINIWTSLNLEKRFKVIVKKELEKLNEVFEERMSETKMYTHASNYFHLASTLNKIGNNSDCYGRKSNVVEMYREMMEENKRVGQPFVEFVEEAYNIPAYSEPRCVIINESPEMQIMQWGMIPHTAKLVYAKRYNQKNWFKNARAEDIFTTWPYKFCIRSRRCLIPSTGYFEYHYGEAPHPIPYFIYLNDRELFSMGGIWDTWLNPETGEQLNSFTQITTAANAYTRKIHNGGNNPYRQPLILAREDEDKWLDPNLTDEEIKALLQPYPEEHFAAYAVSRDFRSINPKSKRVIREMNSKIV